MKDLYMLLVEDDPDDEELTLKALKRHQIANPVRVVHDGAQALDFLLGQDRLGSRESSLPQVVLLDLKLPKIDGLEVLQAIRGHESTKNLPVIIFTSSREESDIIKAYGLGVNSFVRKPVEFEEFMAAVGQLGMYWLLLNTPHPDAGKS
jgi:two-component system, response regulator